jgi:hypothetical protein
MGMERTPAEIAAGCDYDRTRPRPGGCFYAPAVWKTGSIKKYGFLVMACSIWGYANP